MKNPLVEFVGTIVISVGITMACFEYFSWVGTMEGKSIGVEDMKREAVLMGHAEYVVDEDGSPKWQWKVLSQESK